MKRKEFHIVFELSRTEIFDVDYYTLLSNSHPYFSTSAAVFNRPKTDYNRCGQCQEDITKGHLKARAFWNKWNEKHLKDLTEAEYWELIKDLDGLKSVYNYIEETADSYAGTNSYISFRCKKELSMQPIKKGVKK